MMSFSVLMSVYYKEKPEYLQQALKSIWDTQTLKPDEIVIVKDGPLTEELDSIISTFKQSAPVKIIQLEKNVGLGIALSIGIKECKNEYIARMDSDDICKPDRFEKQIKYLNEGYDVVSCWSDFFEGDINNIIATKKRPEYHKDIVKLSKRRSPVCHAATMYKKTAVLKAGNYIHFPFYEDYHLWIRMIMAGCRFYNIQESLLLVRSSYEQIGRRGGYSYLKTEIQAHYDFHKLGFLNIFELIRNISFRIIIRLNPIQVRKYLYLLIWKR